MPRGICAARTLPPQKLATSIKAPTSPYLIHDVILLLPPSPLCGKPGPFISGQKIRGICEGKIGLCEGKVKSGGSPENRQRPPVRERPNTLRYSNLQHRLRPLTLTLSRGRGDGPCQFQSPIPTRASHVKHSQLNRFAPLSPCRRRAGDEGEVTISPIM